MRRSGVLPRIFHFRVLGTGRQTLYMVYLTKHNAIQYGGCTMDSFSQLKTAIDQFADDRDWGQFHTPASLAKSISIEAGELLECFQWSETSYSVDAVKEELADVLNYCIRMASIMDLDVETIVLEKLEKNAQKYPVAKAKGN